MSDALLPILERIAKALERAFPVTDAPLLDDAAIAYRWHYPSEGLQRQAQLLPIHNPQLINVQDLCHLTRQSALIMRNTRQFVAGKPANHVLLTGTRGVGKSSLVKACLAEFHQQGLRLIELDRDHLADLPMLLEKLKSSDKRFIIFCDDLSFDEGDSAYKGLKSALDGSLSSPSDNVLIYATSNRRHLMQQRIEDNLSVTRSESGELNPGETVEEKVSLSERFGLWLSFYPFTQEQYLDTVAHWLKVYGAPELTEQTRLDAINWATQRGSRSARVAMQFARDQAIDSLQ